MTTFVYMSSRALKIVKYSLSLLLAAVLVYFAFRGVDWKAFLDGLAHTRWIWIVLFFAVSIAALLLRMFRWKAMLKPLDPEVKGLRAWDAANIGNIVNVVLPGAGEFVRCGVMRSSGLPYEKVFGTILMERIWDVAAIFLLLIAALLCGWKRFGSFFINNFWVPITGRFESLVWILPVILLAAAVLAVVLIFRFRSRNALCGKAAGMVEGLFQGFASFARMERKWTFAALTAGIWISYVVMSWCVLKAIPAVSDLGFPDALFLSAAGNLASVIPVPGGIGAYHYIVALTLSGIFGASWETGLLFATLNHESHAVLVLVLGVLSYFRISIQKEQ